MSFDSTTKFDKVREAVSIALETLSLNNDISVEDFRRLQEDVNELVEMWQFELKINDESSVSQEVLDAIHAQGFFTSKDGEYTIH
jgi:cell fate (sporulation/competence/biofilm development) regulator YmcA (YheA/YmcA/DUF963 family)